jgi:glycosyltransferase involved in cell wall biosynthesis
VRLLVVVQRYGSEIAGGSEQAARLYATQLVGRGHDVDVLTSCARSYVDWANEYAAGREELEGVTVHRLPVARVRRDRFFGPLNGRAVYGNKPVPVHLQRQWMQEQGPLVPGLAGWIEERAGGYDATIFFTYLYFTAWSGIPAAWHRAPIVFHPTAHDEPPLYLPLFDPMFRMASAFAYFTEEEADLVAERFRVRAPGAVIGIGQDLDVGADPAAFRAAHGLGDAPYLLYVGRVDPGKGSDELYDFFVAYKSRNPGPLRLVIVGEPVKPLPPHPDLTVTGFVDDDVKNSAMAGALALVHPSYFESFGMNPYRGYGEFEAAVDRLSGDPGLQRRLGEQGRRYVEDNYRWDVVLDRYQDLLDRAVADFAGER